MGAPRFADDLSWLRAHTDVVELEANGGRTRLALAPSYQGRVLTSTLEGPTGASQGWLGRAQIEAGRRAPHMCAWGGEDRFWVGPEGGRFALGFGPGAPFDHAHWSVPEVLDWTPWQLLERHADRARTGTDARFENRAGARFEARLERDVRLLSDAEVAALLRAPLDASSRTVGFRSDNVLKNRGRERWSRERGTLCIWTLGMFPASERCTLAVPFEPGPSRLRGEALRADYFGLPGPDRFGIDRRRGLFGLKADGRFRCKLGVPRRRAEPWLGAWDAERDVLTLVHTGVERESEYVDSRWQEHEDAYDGDVVNVYNDGPLQGLAPQPGTFFELETSSPARELDPGERLEHAHTTLHVRGARDVLDGLARAHLRVGLDELERAFS